LDSRHRCAHKRTLETKVRERTRELALANRHLEELSLTDVLTGLPNRRHAMRQQQSEWDTDGSTLACVMIDCDGFKQVNDTYGHDAGDLVLKGVAQCLQDRIRTDDLASRLGGDEFLVICPNTGLTGAMHLGEQMREAINGMRVKGGDGHWEGGISVGVAVRTDSEGPSGLDNTRTTTYPDRVADRPQSTHWHTGPNRIRLHTSKGA